jgi:hypothetical protein
MDQCEECQRLETPTRQPPRRLVSLALRSRSTTENQGPEKFEARARTVAAEQERVKGPPKAGRRSGSNRASVRMRVLLDRQRPRN